MVVDYTKAKIVLRCQKMVKSFDLSRQAQGCGWFGLLQRIIRIGCWNYAVVLGPV